MEKYFIPFVIIIMVMSTIVVAAAGDRHLSNTQGEKICVQSRSCAINYMNKLESEQE